MFFVQTLLPIFATTVLPVFLVAGGGYLLASFFKLDSRSIGRMIFYLATPSLVFRSLYQLEIDPAALQTFAAISAAVTITAGITGWLVSAGQDRPRRAAIVLAGAISNNGNMGIPLSYFAFGAPGLALGSVYYVVSSVMSNTVGVVIASAGKAKVTDALLNGLRVPMLYTASAGLLLNATHIELPVGLFRAVDLLADATIPGMLILLGIQLRSTSLAQDRLLIAKGVSVRLLLAPVLAWLLCWWLGISGVERNVLILQAAMPTAVMSALLAGEYDAAPTLVATIVFVSTLLSMLSTPVVLWLLQ
jgi:predicted permease